MNSFNRLSRDSTNEATYARSPDWLVIARALWAGKWQIAAIIAVTMVLAAVYVATIEPQYTARTTLSLEGPTRKLMNFGETSDNTAADEKKFQTEVEVLRSRGLVEKLVQQLSLFNDPEFNPNLAPADSAWDWLRQLAGLGAALQPGTRAVLTATINRTVQAISVEPILETYLIEVYIRTNSPEKSAEMANTLARLYIATGRDSDREANNQGVEWLTAQVGELREALEASERKAREFSASAEVTSPEALDSQNAQLKALRDRYLHSQTKIRQAETRMALLDDVLNGAIPETDAAVAADSVLSAALGLREASGSPQDANNAAASRLAASVEGERIEAERDRERRLAETTAAAIADLEARVERQFEELVQLRQLQREVDANTAIYEFALNRLKQLSVERGIDQSVEQAPVRVLSKAEPPLRPSGPGFDVIAALAIGLGAFVGVFVILVRQGAKDSFRTAEEIETLSGIQVLGQVLELPTHRRPGVMKYIMSNEASPFSESIRDLRTAILTIAGIKPTVIVLSSALPGEGKTTLALALTRSMSDIGKTVLAIDADLRGRTLGRHFRTQRKSAGLVAAMRDGIPISDLVIHDEALEADVLLSEASYSNAADLFSLPDLKRVLEEARRSYQITIIDTPPTLLVPDAKLIGPHADMMLMAVRWNQTTKWQFTDAVRELQMANCATSGFVLTRMDPKGMPRYGFGDRRGLVAAHRSSYYNN
jgi:succinoglycan biosynthesis transport protein ExoP